MRQTDPITHIVSLKVKLPFNVERENHEPLNFELSVPITVPNSKEKLVIVPNFFHSFSDEQVPKYSILPKESYTSRAKT